MDSSTVSAGMRWDGGVKPKDLLLALLVVVIWGFNFVAIHLGLANVPPLLFAAIRFAFVCLALPFVPRPRVAWRDLAAVGLLMLAGQFGFTYSSMAAGLASGLTSLVVQAQSLFTVAIAAVVLKERPQRVQVLGMAVAFTGLVVVAVGRSGATPLVGLLLAVGAAFCWGAGNVASRRCTGAQGLQLTVWSAAFAPVPLFLLSLLVDGPHAIGHAVAHLDSRAWLSTAYTVVLSTLVAYSIWNTLLARYQTANVVPFTLLVPVVGVFAGWAILGERPNLAVLFGGLLLLLGVAVVILGPRLAARRGVSSPA